VNWGWEISGNFRKFPETLEIGTVGNFRKFLEISGNFQKNFLKFPRLGKNHEGLGNDGMFLEISGNFWKFPGIFGNFRKVPCLTLWFVAILGIAFCWTLLWQRELGPENFRKFSEISGNFRKFSKISETCQKTCRTEVQRKVSGNFWKFPENFVSEFMVCSNFWNCVLRYAVLVA
jgi:hypothetical protein